MAYFKKIHELEETIESLINRGEEFQLLVEQGFSWLDEQSEEYKLSDKGLDDLNYLRDASTMVDKITNFNQLVVKSDEQRENI